MADYDVAQPNHQDNCFCTTTDKLKLNFSLCWHLFYVDTYFIQWNFLFPLLS